MAWLKYTPVFKHGYGAVGYSIIYDMDALEDIKCEIWAEYGDTEGFRSPLWEIVDIPPADFILNKLADLVEHRARISNSIEKLADIYYAEYGFDDGLPKRFREG